MTERGHYRFTVKEGARGHFWAKAELKSHGVLGSDNGILSEVSCAFQVWGFLRPRPDALVRVHEIR